ncbi:MAG: hypothetical protein WCK09_22610, partial [Bacteroidota bacterium]
MHYGGESWLFKSVSLTGGTSYRLSVWARQDGATTANATIELKYGTTNTIAGMTNTIVTATGVGSAYQQVTGLFTPSSTGTYYVCIHGYINYTPWYLTIDDVSLDVAAPANAAPITFTATAITNIGMTVNWIDNSTNELAFRVYRSTNGVTYTKVGADIPSTSTASTGTAYNQVQTGLMPGTLYYFRIVAVADAEGPYLSGSATTAPPVPICGTKTVGAAGDYVNLTAAFNGLAGSILTCPVVLQIRSDYTSAAETWPLILPSILGSSATNTITLKPNVGVTAAVTGTPGTGGALVKIYNSNTIIDGSNAVGGTTRDLTFTNNSATTPQVIFVGSSGTTPLTNLTIKNTNLINGAQTSSAFVFG